MNRTITYTPVYLGLLASLWFALLCNLFLDALYGIFAVEVIAWSAVMAATSWIGWSQRHRPWPRGPGIRKLFLGLAFVALFVVFLPMWFVPRGIVYFIVAIQVANNTQPLTRKNLYYGLVIAAAIVIFASGHLRATWAMLFYILPFVVAAVFTLVADQVSHQAEEFRAQSVGRTAAGREWIAIASASVVILAVAAILYALVPQTSWRHMEWRHGLPAAGTAIPGKDGKALPGGADASKGRAGESILRSPEELREMAGLQWMPGWQAAAMAKLADLTQAVQEWWEPIWQELRSFLLALWARFLELVHPVGAILVAVAVLVAALLAYFREIRPLQWLRTRIDYARFGWLGQRGRGPDFAIVLYRALERLGDYCGEPRPATRNAWEYLQQLRITRTEIRADLTLLTLAFEGARYGKDVRPADWPRLRGAYRRVYRSLTD